MIEFSGYLSGKAEKRYAQKERKFMLSIFAGALAIVSVPLVAEGIKARSTFIIALCAAMWPIFLGLALVASGKKHRRDNMAKKIVVDEDCITAITKTAEETRLLSDVLVVFDSGEYYEFSFSGIKASYRFICQKTLLSSGSLEEFEALFAEKLVRL